MSQKLVRVKIDGAEASVSESFAASHNLKVLADKPAVTGFGKAIPQKYPPEQLVSVDLQGAELNGELEAAGLSTSGSLKDRQSRLAEHRQAQNAGGVPSGEIGAQS